jgi:glycosyltransferase involved in cell wall biosynthesis
MASLSVVITTFNEERNIGRCLASVKSVADDIVVVDSFSTDATETICRSFGATFIKRPWDDYSSAKNFGNGKAAHDLVLSLDADEALSPVLQESVVAIKSAPAAEAYKFSRLTNYCGAWVKHGGWYPDIKIRIFDRRNALWQGTIHEQLTGVDKKSAHLLPGDCFHYSYYSLAEHLQQARRFSAISARELFARGKKPSLLKLLLNPPAKFLRDYLLKAGFLDGRRGLYISVISAYASFRKYAELGRLNKTGTGS